MDAVETIAQSLHQQGCHHGAVHAAGEGQQNLTVAHLFADGSDLLVDEFLHIEFHAKGTAAEFQFFFHILTSQWEL